jgi:hypothetical protein
MKTIWWGFGIAVAILSWQMKTALLKYKITSLLMKSHNSINDPEKGEQK